MRIRGSQKIQNRIGYLLGQAANARAHLHLSGPEVSALPIGRTGDDDLILQHPPMVRLKHVRVLRNAHDLQTFSGVYNRLRRRQFRACAQNATRHIRALRKLAKSYVERPGAVDA